MIDIACYIREGTVICICSKRVVRNTREYMKVIVFTLPVGTFLFII